jgi:hypothetical protein
VNIIPLHAADSEGPSGAEMAEIEQEWPLIAAELDLLDAEISALTAAPAVSVLDRRRIRRAERRFLAAKRELAAAEAVTDGAA